MESLLNNVQFDILESILYCSSPLVNNIFLITSVITTTSDYNNNVIMGDKDTILRNCNPQVKTLCHRAMACDHTMYHKSTKASLS